MFCGYLCFLVSFPVYGFYSIYSVWTCSIISVCYDTFIAIHTAKLRHIIYYVWRFYVSVTPKFLQLSFYHKQGNVTKLLRFL